MWFAGTYSPWLKTLKPLLQGLCHAGCDSTPNLVPPWPTSLSSWALSSLRPWLVYLSLPPCDGCSPLWCENWTSDVSVLCHFQTCEFLFGKKAAVSVCHRFYTIYQTSHSIVCVLIMHVMEYLFQLLKSCFWCCCCLDMLFFLTDQLSVSNLYNPLEQEHILSKQRPDV